MPHEAWVRRVGPDCPCQPVRSDPGAKGYLTPAVPRNVPADSPYARKYRAEVLAVRLRRDGESWVCSLREPEARAVVAAAGKRRDVPMRDADGRVVGLVTV